MQVFVYEYLCAQPHPQRGSSLAVEGWAMLRAAVEDFASLPGVNVLSLLANDHPGRLPGECHRPCGDSERALFTRLAGRADLTLVIAPEFDGLLLERCRWVEESAGRLLNPPSSFIARVSDKLELSRLCLNAGLPMPLTQKPPAADESESFALPSPPLRGRGGHEAGRAQAAPGGRFAGRLSRGQP